MNGSFGSLSLVLLFGADHFDRIAVGGSVGLPERHAGDDYCDEQRAYGENPPVERNPVVGTGISHSRLKR